MGCKVSAINSAEIIPITVTIEIEYNAGCFANISTPTPSIVVITESKIEVL